MISIDNTDRKILNILQSDGRMTNADLAEKIHLSASACLRRVKHLEDAGAIKGYAMVVDPATIGRPTVVFVEITLANQCEDTLAEFEAAVQQHEDIMECYLVSGEADYLLKVLAADTGDYERVHKMLARLPGIVRTNSNFVIRTVAEKGVIRV